MDVLVGDFDSFDPEAEAEAYELESGGGGQARYVYGMAFTVGPYKVGRPWPAPDRLVMLLTAAPRSYDDWSPESLTDKIQGFD